MLDYTYVAKYDIHYFRAREPFSLNEFLLLLMTPPVEAASPTGPVILDFRQIKLERIAMHDIRRHLIKKGDMAHAPMDYFCAYVVDGPEAASKVRVANIFSELTGLTPEENTFVTEDITEATAWIARNLKENKFKVYQELEAMALIENLPPPHGAI